MRADGFPSGSTIFLDVERVNTVSSALLDYYRAWVAGVLNDGRYKPGVYVTKVNAPALHDIQIRTANGGLHTPPFWIASAGVIDSTTRATDIGLDYARVWQSSFDVTQTFNGVSLRIDVNLATKPNPSAP
jgi:GH25 family lysozyme M1 (1,4-beta-N-acetylmuramidase)